MRKKLRLPVSFRLLVPLLAFSIMILFCYSFISSSIFKQLTIDTNNILDNVSNKIYYDLESNQQMLESFASALRNMILHNYSEQDMQEYFNSTAMYVHFTVNNHGVTGLFGYFDCFEKPVFIESFDWDREGFDPTTRPWYQPTLDAEGDIVETLVYSDAVTGEIVVITSLCVYDNEGKRLGIVGVRTQMALINQIIEESFHDMGSYGFLVSQDFRMIAHPETMFLNKPMIEVLPIWEYLIQDLTEDVPIYLKDFENYKGRHTILSMRKLHNGWYLGIILLKDIYYRTITNLLLFLSILGVGFSLIISILLLKIDQDKDKAIVESHNKSSYIANMSHEIRTPLNAILGMTTLGQTAEDLEKKNYCFKKIDEASSHLLGLINNILDLAKIESGKFSLSTIEFNFEEMVQKVVNIITYKINSKNQQLDVIMDHSIPTTVIGDDLRITQIITNLLSNANKFTPDGGKITLEAKLLNKMANICLIQVSVQDTGIGMSKEQQKLLFNSFQQASVDTTRNYGGTGLGLVISKQIVEMMNGKIWVCSDTSKGTTFFFTIEAAEGENKEIANKQFSNINDVFKDHRILIAEDVEINREIITLLLEPTGVKIDLATNGAQAVEKYKEYNNYDLILMDINMPELTGLEATQAIRGSMMPRAKEVPIVAMTASVFNEDIAKCLEVGMNDHIGKPIEFDKLLVLMNKYLT